MKLSIIIVAYNIENFIEQAMRSCVFPGATDYEVIVVHNCSTDDTLKYVNRTAAEFPTIFRVIENAENVGLGQGRNIGLAASTGDYILFLDGDDWFSPSLFSRAAYLMSERDFDVCIFSYARAYDDGRVLPNKLTPAMAEGFRNGYSERVGIASILGVAWNKLYKRAFIERNKLSFNVGFYEDIDWNFEVLLLAERLYVIPDVLAYYRQREGSITRSRDARHFDNLVRYRRVIDLLSNHPGVTRDFIEAAYRYARGQALNVLSDGGRLPRDKECDYAVQASAMLEEFRSLAGVKQPTLREKILRRGNPFYYKLMHRLLRAIAPYERAFLRRYRAARKIALDAFTPMPYKAQVWAYKLFLTKLPINQKRVFLEAYWGDKVDCNPYAISQYLTGNTDFECIWSLKDPSDPLNPPVKAVRRNSWAYLRAAATSKYFISNVNFADEIIKRPGQIHIQTQHGTPIKLMATDMRPTRPKEMDWQSYAVRARRWDYVISSNDHSTRVWRQSSPYGYQVLEIGYPRNDVFFSPQPALLEKLRSMYGIAPDKKVAMYAPTFRDNNPKKGGRIQDDTFDAVAAKAALGPDWVLLMRSHHFAKFKNVGGVDGIIDASSYRNFNELAVVVDLLITDYSSVMFDFACLRRPIALFTYDYDTYVAGRGVYFDVRKKAPGVVTESMPDLVASLREREFEAPGNHAKLKSFAEEFCKFDDGLACKRLVEAVFK